MSNDTSSFWTIGELAERVSTALAADYEGQPSLRISDVPNARVIRYYTTLGLLDRPAAMRGRTALYGRRHLLQLVAIKRLQAGGLSLAEVQARLAGLPDSALLPIARLPAGTAPESSPPAPRASGRRKQAFWSAPIETPAEPAPTPPGLPVTRTWQSLELAPGVIVMLERSSPFTPQEQAALMSAGMPLLQVLAQVEPQSDSKEGSRP